MSPTGFRSEAMDARSEATDTRSKAMNARSEAMDARSEATDARSEATDARNNASDKRSGLTYIRRKTANTRTNKPFHGSKKRFALIRSDHQRNLKPIDITHF
ncbi:MAG: hypothetical protein CFE23_09130 [Flavobacterium sp. BFFFF1]|uniref:hypothetical protein n=1 Tax=Flavobacterium sp. BFFFF1 TaxID=2015557 RepID=UPI000BCA1A86|nr:hypothetical protein [Flavobacterium sp. BFFFF1]OYU80410.1 MAG: hypothetical protein CFE23_09130 [Flavobacterium sp. BFFFF1]